MPERRWLLLTSAAMMVVGVLAMLLPVVAAPLTADQRYMYLEGAAVTSGGWHEVVTVPLAKTVDGLENGRVATLGIMAQYAQYRGTADLAIVTGIPIVALHGVQKVVIFAVSVLSVLAFARALRARTPGGLTRLSGRSLALLGAGLAVVGAAGVQTQQQFANAWVSYPLLTYGAVVACFGSAALAVVVTRWYARSPRLLTAAVLVVAMGLLGLVLNASYELYLVAYPAAMLALLAQPLTDDRSPPQRRAKVIAAAVLTVTTVVPQVLIRRAVSAACGEPGAECYSGVKPRLGGETVELFWVNLVSSIPGSGRNEVVQQLRDAGIGGLPGVSGPGPGSFVLLVLAGAVGLVLLGVAKREGRAPAPAGLRPQLAMLGLLAAVGLGVAVGSALIMSVSERVPDIVTGVGDPYRHTVVTWFGFALVAVSVVLALDLALGRSTGPWQRARWVPWAALAGVVAVVVGTVLPYNVAASKTEALSPYAQTIDAIHREVLLADRTPAGDERRCETLRDIGGTIPSLQTRDFLARAVTRAYQRYNDQPYCTDEREATRYFMEAQ
ncbi:MAG: hypothetical protein GEU96_04705 [Propionibacteriales bacterium]|nr:hypothetical protein [Propionibacteriales bacterium]